MAKAPTVVSVDQLLNKIGSQAAEIASLKAQIEHLAQTSESRRAAPTTKHTEKASTQFAKDDFTAEFEEALVDPSGFDVDGNLGIRTSTPAFSIDVGEAEFVADRTFGILGEPVVFLPDQDTFPNSIALGGGLRSLSHTSGEDGFDNIAIGVNALPNVTSGRAMTAVGSYALNSATSNFGNTAIGVRCLQIAVPGTPPQGCDNSGVGTNCLQNTTLGFDNIAMGVFAMNENETGSENTGLGTDAFRHMVDGTRNAAVGCMAGRFLNGAVTHKSSGIESIYLGYQAQSASNSAKNEIVIGAFAQGIGSNTVVLGSNSVVTTALKGSVGIGTTVPSTQFHVVSGANVDCGIQVETSTPGRDPMVRFAVNGSLGWRIGMDTSDGYGLKFAYGTIGVDDRFAFRSTGVMEFYNGTAPTGPISGVKLYAEGGRLKAMTSDGVVHTLA